MESRISRNGRVSAGWIMAMAMLTGGQAIAQTCDGQFQTGNGVPGISGDGSGALMSFDPDGAGPTPELLYAGGFYKLAHTTIVNSLASWEPLFNGQNPTGIWRNVAGGVTSQGGLGAVNVMLPIGTDMLVGGFFDTAGVVGATNVVKYSGATNTWVPYGTGVPGPVYCATVFNGQIFIGGEFRLTVGQTTGDSVARWDGTRWRPVGPGFSVPDPTDDPPSTPPRTLPGPVYALQVFNNTLYAGGGYVFSGRTPEGQPIPNPHFSLWNPQFQVWVPMLSGPLQAPFPYSPAVYTMRVFGNQFYVGGLWDNIGNSFVTSDGVPQTAQPPGVIAPVNGGVFKLFDTSKVYSMTQVGQELVIGGDFEYAGIALPAQSANLVRWNGARYLSVADGGTSDPVYSVTTHRGQIAAMGSFGVVAGQRIRGVAWYDGNMWKRTGLSCDAPMFAMRKYNGQLICAGSFGRTPGDVMASGIAAFNGTTWSQLGSGLQNGGTQSLPAIYGMTEHNNELVAVGEFTRSGITANFANIASWNGARWTPVGQVDGPVYDAQSYRGQLFIAGDLLNYGNIAQYDGFGGYQSATFGTDGPGLTLDVFNNELVAGGVFQLAGGVGTGPIAKWNYDTETWSEFNPDQIEFLSPDPENIPVFCSSTAVIDGQLYIGGNWVSIGGDDTLAKFNRWDAEAGQWVAVGNGGPDFDVWAIHKVGNSIYVGGAGGVGLMAWDGTAWRTVDGGTDGTVYALGDLNNRLYIGGNFLTASNEPSAYFSSYIPDVPVSITTGPVGSTLCEGGSVTMSVTVAGSGPYTYQWKRNNVNVPGATAPTLTLNPATPANAGNYTVTVSNACSSATSGAAAVAVNAGAAITGQPVNRDLCTGSALNLSVTATGSAPIAYQWKLNGTNIPGATAATYTVASAQPANAGSYTVVVSNGCATVTSNAAAVTVSSAPSITTQPQGQTLCNNTALNLSVTATGTGPLAYQWKLNGTNIPGATASTYSVANPSAANAGTYTVTVSNTCNTVTSNGAVVTVGQGPAITQQPQGGFGCIGGTLTMSVTATGTPLNYQWQRNNENIPGATSASYTIPALNNGTVGTYRVIVSNGCGSTTSNNAVVSVCGADFNCDGFVDFFDYFDFTGAFEAGLPAGDFNGDDFIDFFDYFDFTGAFQAGC